MRGIDELDYYELLEISSTASAADIDRAYRMAQQTYADDSLALYTVFENVDASSIRERLDEAYRVLADPETRESYDLAQGRDGSGSGASEDARCGLGGEVGSIAASGDAAAPAFDDFDGGVDEYDALEEEGGEFDGVRLRRARLFRGYEIEDICEVTKVSGAHLRNIEDENFLDLPADVYVRGFVTAYARTIGLDPDVVVPSYMARMQDARQEGTRGRFLGRR
ncbi:MAG: helix-turn-helix domain-containing protein [Deltaproteobacteria bacterium]|jgi:DnaJ-class molecular chaperone|nr:helix-turn-helix domain-containing protein [Deltaproteobacteria bacterium]